MKLAIATGSIVLVLAGAASAQPAPAAPSPPAAPALARVEPPPAQADEKSERVATTLSLAGALAAVGLVVGATFSTDEPARYSLLMTTGSITALVGPSLGHWYAGKLGTRGLALRAAGAATALLGLGAAMAECPLLSSDCQPMLGIGLLVVGAGVFVGGMVDDVITASARVRRYNRERAAPVIAPVVTGQGAGLALGGTF